MSDESKSVFSKISRDIKAEMGRLGDHGAAELASALFSGHSFLPYGSGQRRDHEVDRTPSPANEISDRGIER
ncbi:MAG: hypothetical protein JNL67_16480 [Planctomycetaceae bacterium]|nr:hypothetical protein [Planctomycetaceae bacterium]